MDFLCCPLEAKKRSRCWKMKYIRHWLLDLFSNSIFKHYFFKLKYMSKMQILYLIFLLVIYKLNFLIRIIQYLSTMNGIRNWKSSLVALFKTSPRPLYRWTLYHWSLYRWISHRWLGCILGFESTCYRWAKSSWPFIKILIFLVFSNVLNPKKFHYSNFKTSWKVLRIRNAKNISTILIKFRFLLKILAIVGVLDRPLIQRWRGRGVLR